MTKQQWIDKFRAENPEIWIQVNDERIQLLDNEYEAKLSEWADNQIAYELRETEKQQLLTIKESGKAKLKALGLSDAEIEALVG